MNRVVLVGYLARQVSVEQHRGGHLVGRTLLVVPRGRSGRARGADFVALVIQGRDNVLAAVELVAGNRVWVLGRLAATHPDACAERCVVVARELLPWGTGRAIPRWPPVVVAVERRPHPRPPSRVTRSRARAGGRARE